jgi:hypothetical protein
LVRHVSNPAADAGGSGLPRSNWLAWSNDGA